MPVFRVERNKGYTVMSNYHLRDKSLSLKAKGLLLQILSLPEDWDYTLSGLCYINRESKDAIRSAVNELERAGYRGDSGSASVFAAAMMDLSQVSKYYVACGYTDLRRGIDGLAAIVTQQYGQELREESLFLFCGRRTDRIKALYYSGDGYVLLYKRLNNGAFQWPRTAAELRQLDTRSFRWLMEGLQIDQPKAIQIGSVFVGTKTQNGFPA